MRGRTASVVCTVTLLGAFGPSACRSVPAVLKAGPVVKCEEPEDGHVGSAVHVVAVDEKGRVIRNATASFTRPGEPTVRVARHEIGSRAWLKPGSWTVEVSSPYRQTRSFPVEIDAARVCTATVLLPLGSTERPIEGVGGALVVLVIDQSGAPLPGVEVSVAAAKRLTDVDGTVRFDGLAPGPYLTRAELAGFSSRKVKANVREGYETTVYATVTLTSTP